MTDRELRSRRLLVGTVTVSLVLMAVYSWFHLASARAEASQARQTLGDCETLIEAIRTLGKKPTKVLTQSNTDETIGEMVAEAIEVTRLPRGVLKSVKPAETERIGRTDYQNSKHRIIVECVTLQQILQVVQNLESRAAGTPNGSTEGAETAGLRVRDLTLTVNETSQPGRELWNAEAVLTQTVYSPTKR